MKENSGLSAFRIWLHPRRSRREMESLLERNAELEAQLVDAGEDISRRMAEKDAMISRMADDNSNSSRQAKKEIKALRMENERLRSEVLEWQQARIEMDSINAQLKEWEKVKEQYEKRIRKLKNQLGEASERSSRRLTVSSPDSEILDDGEPLYMDPEEMKERERLSQKKSGKRMTRLPKDDSDWLLTLPPDE